MERIKKLAALLMAMLFVSLTGCGYPGITQVYGRFVDYYTVGEFNVQCDWDSINPSLDACEYEKYGLYINFFDDEDFRSYEEALNIIWLNDDLPADKGADSTGSGRVQIAYGAINYSPFMSRRDSKYFAEPMIEVYLYDPDAKHELEPDYLPGYRAVFSLDGVLALQEGDWFLEEDKAAFCLHYFDMMMKSIGKGK